MNAINFTHFTFARRLLRVSHLLSDLPRHLITVKQHRASPPCLPTFSLTTLKPGHSPANYRFAAGSVYAATAQRARSPTSGAYTYMCWTSTPSRDGEP